MVARFDLVSVSLAQKPKSAGGFGLAIGTSRVDQGELTDLDIATSV